MKTYHLRNKEMEITDQKEIMNIFTEAKYMTIAMCKGNEAYLSVLSHGYDRKLKCIYFHCASEGKKIDFLKANPNVWGIVFRDDGYAPGKCNHYYRSVMFRGQVEFLTDSEKKRNAFKVMMASLEKDNPKRKKTLISSDKLDKTVVCRIKLSHISGKRNSPNK